MIERLKKEQLGSVAEHLQTDFSYQFVGEEIRGENQYEELSLQTQGQASEGQNSIGSSYAESMEQPVITPPFTSEGRADTGRPESDIAKCLSAKGMIEAFESVGVQCFDLTITDEVSNPAKKRTRQFKRNLSGTELKQHLDSVLPQCERERLNVIVRPHAGSQMYLAQLDDLSPSALKKIQNYCFITLETSPNNYQAWIAIEGGDIQSARRLRTDLNADRGASGAVRLAGSRNFKPKHQQINYPQIKVIDKEPGLITDVQQLEEENVLNSQAPRVNLMRPNNRSAPRTMPNYDNFMERAHLNSKGQIDRSRVDFAYSTTALRRGFSREEVRSVLLKSSSKARERGNYYVDQTLNAAMREVARAESENSKEVNDQPRSLISSTPGKIERSFATTAAGR
jgi:hypothetical protein